MINSNLEFLLNKAVRKSNILKHEFVTLENVLLQLLDDPQVIKVLTALSVEKEEIFKELDLFLLDDSHFSVLTQEQIEEIGEKQFQNEEIRAMAKRSGISFQPELSLALQRVIQRAALHIQNSGKREIMPIHLFVSIFSEAESHAVYILNKFGIEKAQVIEIIAHDIDKPLNAETVENNDSMNPKPEGNPVEAFTVNLTELAQNGKIDPLVGRQNEVNRLIQTLSRRRKNNPLLVGDAGVGKTAIVEGLALAIAQNKTPDILKDQQILSLDMASLMAGTKFRGDFEQKLKTLINHLKNNPNIILFIDEIHTIIGAGSVSGGSLDASNMLKPALSRGDIRCIGSTTFDEYRKVFEKDQALNRRFQKIDIEEPSLEDTKNILIGIKSKYEDFHQMNISNEMIDQIITLSQKYITGRKFPDKAIDVLDEVGARIKLIPNREKNVTLLDIEEVISEISKIPRQSLSFEEKDKLKTLKQDLKLLLYGQDNVIESAVDIILTNKSGLGRSNKPIASFLFAGPTGVGKTELAKQLAFQLGLNFHRIDMSEYMEKHSIAKLIGSPPGYVGFDEGGLLTEAVNKNPYSVILLDEIEKAHIDIYNILLQVLDNGKLTDSQGKVCDFRNTIIILTSNIGAFEMESGSIGFTSVNKEEVSKREQKIKQFFSPEFRNRLDHILHFNKLSKQQILSVVNKFIAELEEQLEEKKIQLIVSDDAREWLAQRGFDPKLGARPMARTIDQEIKKLLAHEILFGKLQNGGKAFVRIAHEKLEIDYES